MARQQAGIVLPASSAGLSVSFFLVIRRALGAGRVQAARAAKRVALHAATAAVGALVLLAASVPAYAQNVSFDHVQTHVLGGLASPEAVAVDRAGNVFIADTFNNRVLEVPWNGMSYGTKIILCGSGVAACNGLNRPNGVAVDGAGNLFIADTENSRVLEVTPGGVTTTVPVSGLWSPWGVAVDAAGDLIVVDFGNCAVFKVTPGGVTTTVPTSGLDSPNGVAVDKWGNVFVADEGTGLVVEVPWNGTSYGTQTTVSSELDDPQGVAVDAAGNVFIADSDNKRLVEVPWNGTSFGAQTTVANSMGQPGDVVVDGAGDLVVADTNNNQVVKVLRAPVNINICPGGQTTPAPCSQVLTAFFTIKSDDGVTFSGNPTVLTQGAPNRDFTLSTGASSSCTGSKWTYCNVNLEFAPLAPGLRRGAVQLTYQLNDSSENPTGSNLLATGFVDGVGQGPAIAFAPGVQSALNVTAVNLQNPWGLALDEAGDVFIAAENNDVVVEIPAGGGAQTTMCNTGDRTPGVAVDGAGNLFCSDAQDNRVYEVLAGTNSETEAAGSIQEPTSLAIDGRGNLFIVDDQGNQVLKAPYNGSGYGQTIKVPASGLNSPEGVAVDGTGNVFIADSGNNQVVEVPWNVTGYGAQTTLISGLNFPEGVAVDAAGDVWIADSGNNRVLELPAGGGAPVTLDVMVGGLGLNNPRAIVVDATGNIFISDSGNNRALEVQMSAPPSLSFALTVVGYTSTDSPQSVTAQNIGNATLNAVAPGLSVSPDSFLQVAGAGTPSDCASGFSLAPGASCNLSINFTPQATGALTGSATFTDNALNATTATQSVNLSGTGRGAAITSAASTMFTESQINSFTVITEGFAPAPAITELGILPLGVFFVDNGNGTATLYGTPAITTSGTHNLTFTASNETQSNTQSFTLTVTVGAPLTITALSAPMTYGGTVPTITPIYSLPSPIVTGVTCSTQATSSSPVGTYTSSCTGAVGDYVISYAPGTVTVGPATLTASIIGNPAKPYDGTNTATLGSSNFSLSGLVPGQSITVTGTVTGTYASVNVGTGIPVSANLVSVDFTAGGNTQLFNYTLPTTASGTGQITAATVTPSVTASNKTYDGTTTATTACTLSGVLSVDTGNVTCAATTSAFATANAGNGITVTAAGITLSGSAAGNYILSSTTATTTANINQAAATVTLSNLTQTYTGSALTPTVTTVPSGLSYSLSGAPDTGAGSYPVTATVTDPNYQGSASGTFNINQAAATVTLSNLTQTYTGSALTPTVTTVPSGLSYSLSGAPDTGAGSYPVTATVTDPNYQGSSSGTFMINKAAATVTLSNLTQTYTGSALTPTATTTPAGLAIVWTGAPDTNPGSYAVTATVNNPNYQGSASGTFTVNQAPAITSANTTTFTVGTPGSFTVTTTGFPVAAISEGGGLPSGVSFVDNHNGTATLSGTPATGSNPTYNITFTASNGVSPNATQSFTLNVITVSQLKISPASVNFGTVYLGQVGVQFVTLTNTGNTPISISSIKVAAPGNALGDFGDITNCDPFISALPGTLGAGRSCVIAVGFAANVKIFSPTLSTATLVITDNTGGSPQSVALSATVINPQASLSATSLNFSTQKEGSTTTKTVTLTNTGNTPLTLGTLSINGDFAIAPSPATTCANGGTVQPSTSCVISVMFAPEAKGNLTGMLIIPDNAQNSPQMVALTGRGD